MTDTMKLLALAIAINPVVVWTTEGDTVFDLREGTIFDPANNIEQAWAVLAWLLRNRRCDLSHNAVTVWHSNDILICDIDYDGTEAGLRKAVTEAGMRVVS